MIDGGLSIGILFILCGLIPYFILNILHPIFVRSKDLKAQYGAEWAIVTGASSGIGRAFAHKLASQGINVVLVAMPENSLSETEDELKQKYPGIRFRKVGCNLGEEGGGYMRAICDATVDINVQLIFCIAGFMVTGFFYNTPMKNQAACMECNSTSAVRITHHFVSKMVEKKLKGCVVFAASPAGLLPSPFSVLYGSTKAFLQEFAASLAPELKPCGIDVQAFFPSPTKTGFYSTKTINHKIEILEFFKNRAVPAESIPDQVFASLGVCVLKDVGLTSILFRLISKVVDANAMTTAASKIFHLLPDYKRNKNL